MNRLTVARWVSFAGIVFGLAACGPDDWGNLGTNASNNRPRDCPVNSTLPECFPPDAEWGDGSTNDDGGDRGRDAGIPQDAPAVRDASPMCPREIPQCQGNCNDDDGSNYERCIARGNRNGCEPEIFRAWCSRRVGEGLTWEAATREWAANGCDGTVSLEHQSNGYDAWTCRRADGCILRRCWTPLVLVFEASDRVAYTADDGRSHFNLAAAGEAAAERTDWPTAVTPWLAFDRDGDGRITSGSELFGSATPLAAGPAANGFDALSAFDSNGDRRVDARDAAFDRLVLWFDRDHDRQSDPGELQTLASMGIESIDLAYTSGRQCDARGNCEIERASFTWRDGSGRSRNGAIVDVHLAEQP